MGLALGDVDAMPVDLTVDCVEGDGAEAMTAAIPAVLRVGIACSRSLEGLNPDWADLFRSFVVDVSEEKVTEHRVPPIPGSICGQHHRHPVWFHLALWCDHGERP